ncbi:MAG: PAS sensor protein [Sulfurospirillum sp.]|nr:MAG: PAS sensor protein [Sulfurospirillum sp.]
MSKPMPTQHERVMKDDDFIVSKTDLNGHITYCNEIFMQMANMSEEQLLGKPHSIVRHPDMPKAVFKLLWDYVKSGKEIFAYVKNLSADGGYYWVYANVTPSYDHSGNIIGYYSVRIKPSQKALDIIKPLYEKMLSIENSQGVDASIDYLTNLLKEKGVSSYDEFIIQIQD